MRSMILVSIFLVVLLAEVPAAPHLYTYFYRFPHVAPVIGTHRIVPLGPFGPVIPKIYYLPPQVFRSMCPSPWFRVGEQCFLLVNDESDWLSWKAAKDHCKTLAPKANLAQPRDIKVLDGLVQHIFDNDHRNDVFQYWVGASDLITEGEWQYINNDTIPFTDSSGWYPGEPNNHRGDNYQGEDCLELVPYRQALISLNDDNCRSRQAFVCERH